MHNSVYMGICVFARIWVHNVHVIMHVYEYVCES